MKKHLQGLLLVGGICLSSSSFVLAADALTAQKLFESKCAQCHGKDAKGNAKIAKVMKVDVVNLDLTRSEAAKATAEDLAGIVTKGKGKMPTFKAKLTADQIKELVVYVKGLQTAK